MCIQEEISQVNNKENETTRLVGKLHVIGRGTFPYTIYYCQNQRHFFSGLLCVVGAELDFLKLFFAEESLDIASPFSYIILFHGGMFFILFTNFYIQAYSKKPLAAKKKDNVKLSNGTTVGNGTKKHE